MTSLLAAILFAGFAATALAAGLRRTRRTVTIFIAWSLLASFGPWPM